MPSIQSVSATQLDVLMAEMREDPRRAMFVAPRLDHSLKHIGKPRSKDKEMDKDKDRIEREKEKGVGNRMGRSHRSKLSAGEVDDEDDRSNMSKFKRSISWTLMPRPAGETPRNRNALERPAKGGRNKKKGKDEQEDVPFLPPKRWKKPKSTEKDTKKLNKEKGKEKQDANKEKEED